MGWPFTKRSKPMSVVAVAAEATLMNAPEGHSHGHPHKHTSRLHFRPFSSLIPHRHHAVRHSKPDLSLIVLLAPVLAPPPPIPPEEKVPDDDLARAIYWHQQDNLVLSAHYLVRAAEQPHPLVALYLLGVVVREGFGVKINQKLAFDLLVEAATQTRDLLAAFRPSDPASSWILEGEDEVPNEAEFFNCLQAINSHHGSDDDHERPSPQPASPTAEPAAANDDTKKSVVCLKDMWCPVISDNGKTLPFVVSTVGNDSNALDSPPSLNRPQPNMETTSLISTKSVRNQPFVLCKIPNSPLLGDTLEFNMETSSHVSNRSVKSQQLVMMPAVTGHALVDSPQSLNGKPLLNSPHVGSSAILRNSSRHTTSNPRRLGKLNSVTESVSGLAAWMDNGVATPPSESKPPVKEEDVQAVRLFMPLPILEISHCYRHSYGIRKSKRAAIYQLHFAACLGDPDAQSELGLAYLEAFGVHRSKMKAAKWLRLAAEQGVIIPNEGWVYKEKWGGQKPENQPEEHHAIRAKKVMRPPQ
ncbi:hypothetical protein SeMB42_g04013 [Synchytrium endobioticum]|uniref:Uncharacterized protein n=1 Tax=Synchytrium endobioticum TaxID=286115 RepID=A0A507CQS6_9FUNG|nr:hypothetical protein SeLEV6574_g06052 [Synchytrium endobioticum]TPX45404.1 hypothetical protein SeMB42_g04013 [Synchytrium endobioticum]